jgi:hypothetical protein
VPVGRERDAASEFPVESPQLLQGSPEWLGPLHVFPRREGGEMANAQIDANPSSLGFTGWG